MGEPPEKIHEDIQRHPDDPALAIKYGDALYHSGQFISAAGEYRRAVILDESLADAWYRLGRVSLDLGSKGEAVRCFRRTLTLQPHRVLAHFNLGKALFDLGEIGSALEHFSAAAKSERQELRDAALEAIACVIPGSPRHDHRAVLEARREWARILAKRQIPMPPASAGIARDGRKCRVGYCSAFFDAPNWMKPVWGAINHHDRAAFEIHLFSDGPLPKAESGYSADSRDHMHEVSALSNAELASLISRNGIDILVDLNGYSYPRRLGMFLMRPAPLSVAWFSMYATTGIDAFDYIVGDDSVISPSEEEFYCERVLRVPGSYLAFSVLYPVPELTPPPCFSAGHITFGSFCSQYKINDEVVAAWAAILREVPDSRLFVKNRGLGDESNRAALLERFAHEKIAADRLMLEGPADHGEFLEAYARVDIALDAFPYNGGTTTMEALWQGVPVLTFRGDRWAGRQSCSLLLAAGLDEWCAPSVDDYIVWAIALARSPDIGPQLTSLRATMRERLASKPVCDSAGLCRALEGIYRDLSRRDS